MKLVPRKILEALSRELPARDIRHDGRPYLRRYYLGTVLGIRFYLHHFVDSDPDGLHNHPWRFGGSIILNGFYFEERRFCLGTNARRISCINFVHGDTLHRVVIPRKLCAVFQDWVNWSLNNNEGWNVDRPNLGVWTLFWHTPLKMTWNTFVNKGVFTQVVEHLPNHPREEGHSAWYRTAPKGKELFGA